ncbi:hypothetical protein [Actinocrispum wychmicini]|uniref:Uncharacterized protein n=1 Tax=Actinocrispum wychmicini TaxID=1213861 RepID=A0A4R2JJF9_9PSEU|nr:hypothetical protein [Actinocrispum wychmicini]TCO57146.1 hypothetical protein EV192_106623 [Actinocrispum wychmicini]
MKPCSNREFPERSYTSMGPTAVACEMCGHTSLLHPGRDNPALEGCLACELQMLLPPPQGPGTPLTPAGSPPVLAHIAVDGTGGRMRSFVGDEPAAITLAREHNGVVFTVPVSSDWREATNDG